MPSAAASWGTAALAVRSDSSAAKTVGAVLAVVSLILVVLVLVSGRNRVPGGRTSGSRLIFGTAARAAAVPLAAAALVCVCSGILLAERTAGPVAAAIADGSSITGTFRATTDSRSAAADRFSGGPRYVTEAVLEEATGDGRKFSAAATVLVIGGSGYGHVQLGDRFRAAGSLQATEPGERSVALLYANGQPEVQSAGGWYGETARIRAAFTAAAREREGIVGNDAAGLLPGMVLGDRSALDGSVESAMKNTGLTHIVAVSGANCGYLLAFVFLLARAARLPRGVAAAAGVTALLGFVLVVRPDASVLRAAVMGSLGTLAVLSGRGKLPAALLSLSITVLLAVDPWLSGSYAFILSVLATAGLVLLGPRLTEVLARGLPWPVAAALAVPLAAQFFCSPVLVLLQPQVPAFSLPANVAVAPVVPLVTVVGMLAAVAAASVPAAAGPLVVLSGGGAAWTAMVAKFFDGLPGSLVPWPPGTSGVLLMAAAAGAGVWLLWRVGPSGEGKPSAVAVGSNTRRGGASAARRVRGTGNAGQQAMVGAAPARIREARPRWLAFAAVLLVLPALGAAAWTHLRPGAVSSGWIAAACDVGQGDGLVVRTAAHRAVVIDAGPDPEMMDRCLTRLQVEVVDLFILSHAHLDHYGGAAGVLRGRTVQQIAYSSAEPDLPAPLQEVLEGSGAEMTRLTEGMGTRTGAAEWNVLWPEAGSAPANENDASSVILMTVDPAAALTENGQQTQADDGARLTILLTGDIEEDASAVLLSRHAELRRVDVDVLKVPHHGARNGGTALIDALAPRLALISVGADNDYGHPGPEILQALDSNGTVVARTDQLGSVSLTMDGSTLHIARTAGK